MKTSVGIEIHVPIADILSSHPKVSRVFIRNRMGCVGCPFAKFHTLEDVIEIYQLGEELFLREVWDLLDPKDDIDSSKVLSETTSR